MARRLSVPWWLRIPDDALLIIYYVVTMVIGGLTIWGDPAPALVEHLGVGVSLWVFGGCYTVTAGFALASRVMRNRRGEATAVKVLGLAALFHGTLALLDGATASGLRIMIAPLMMWAYARTLSTLQVTRHDLQRLSEAVTDGR